MRKIHSQKRIVLERVNGFLIAALFMFSGCDKANEPSGPVAASFTAGIDGRLSRASGTSFTKGDGVGITCSSGAVTYTNVKYEALDGEKLAVVGEANTIYYNDDKEVTFKAYYPYAGAVGTVPSAITATTDGAKQEPGNQSSIDFLFTNQARGSKASPEVEFSFKHRMSQIALTINAVEGLTSLEKMSEYTLEGLKLEGTFNPVDGVAEATGGIAPLTVAQKGKAGENKVTSTLIVFPQQLLTATFKLTLTDLSGDTQEYTGTMTIPDGELLAGTSYTFNVNVSKTGLTVSKATIDKWNSMNGGDVTAK